MCPSESYPDKAPKVTKLLKTLADPCRREIIHHFQSQSQAETESLDTVVCHIDERMPSKSQTELEIELHHKHLPKLMERGWVDYDDRQETICYYGNEDAESQLTELLAVFE